MNDRMRELLEAVMDAVGALEKAKELLEDWETEPVIEQSKNGVTTWHRCKCGHPLVYGRNYCSECGRAVKWDG